MSSSTDNPIILGIDPGLSGALAAVRLDGSAAGAWPMPTEGREIDARQLSRWIREIAPGLAVVERVGPMPKQGLASTARFMRGYGMVLGVVGALGLPLEQPTPQSWKRCVLAGTDKSKSAALAYAARRFPSLDLAKLAGRKEAREGMAEALCISEWGRRLLVGEAELGKGVA